MAVGTHAGSTWNTTAGNKTVTATPAVNDLIVVVHGMSGWAAGDTSVITDNQSGTYTQIGGNPLSNGGGTAGALWISIRTALIPAASSTIFTATNTGDTGGGLTVLRFSGMSKVGASAAKQNIGENTQTESPPSIAFGAATLTANPIVLGVLGEDNPPALTPPTGFSEAIDTGWATPTTGIEVCWDDAGNTASSYAWSGGALVDHNEVGVELDTSTGTQYNQAVATTSTLTAAAIKQSNKPLALSTTLAATLVKQTSKAIAQGLTVTVGLATQKLRQVAIDVAATLSVGLAKQTNKAISASISFSNTAAKVVAHAIDTGLTLVANLTTQFISGSGSPIDGAGMNRRLNRRKGRRVGR